jgi:hypothetical protein
MKADYPPQHPCRKEVVNCLANAAAGGQENRDELAELALLESVSYANAKFIAQNRFHVVKEVLSGLISLLAMTF